MRREVQGILLILVGGSVLRMTVSGAYLNYVKAGMWWYLIASGVILIALGIFGLLDAIRDSRHAHIEPSRPATADASAMGTERSSAVSLGDSDAADSPSASHDHAHESMRTAWLLLVPVAAIFLIAPPPLGAYTASRESSSVSEPKAGSVFAPLPPGDPVPLLLNDYTVRAVWDDGVTLEGREVELVGFVTPTADGWQLTRLALACCAADAVASKVQPVGDVPSLPANTWVSVVGTYNPGGGTQSDTAVPWVNVRSIQEIPAPADPYL